MFGLLSYVYMPNSAGSDIAYAGSGGSGEAADNEFGPSAAEKQK